MGLNPNPIDPNPYLDSTCNADAYCMVYTNILIRASTLPEASVMGT